jgi:hypothetical protein
MSTAHRIRTPRDVMEQLHCIHAECDGDRHVVQLAAVISLNRQITMPGLAPVLEELRRRYGAAILVSLCIACGCAFPAMQGHPRVH